MVTNDTIQKKEKTVVATIGRWMTPHKGQKSFLRKLAREHDKVIVMIGSCYEGGTERNCISAVEREKMLRAIFKRAEISEEKYEIVPVEDKETFGEWLDDVKYVCNAYGVTHFCTGNQEDILNVLKEKNETLGFEMINPEADSDFPYHSSHIRKMIIEGKYEELKEFIPDEIKPILFKNSFKEILAANQKRGIHFVRGRQTVDVIVLIRNTLDGKVYVLLGKRSMDKVDFPGYMGLPGDAIHKYETAINAAVRTCYEQTGLQIEVLDNSLEPAIVKFENVPKSNLEQMHFVGIYSSEDEKFAGTRGGSSQCFGIFIEDEIYKYEEYLNASEGLTNLKFYEVNDAMSKGLPYQQPEMLKKAMAMFEAYPNLTKTIQPQMKEKVETFMVSFIGASGAGKSSAALGTAFKLKMLGQSVEYVPEFAKGLVYNGVLGKYIPNQSYIVAEQYKQLYDLLGQVDYIVTDAGLEITALHSSKEDEVVEKLAWYLRNKINQVTIFIERDEEKVPFETRGRVETEEQSRQFSLQLEEYLKKNNVKYIKVKGSEPAIEVALNAIKEHEKSRK